MSEAFFEADMDTVLDISYKNNGCYQVAVEEDYSRLGRLLSERFPGLKRICIVSDSNVSKLYLDNVISAVSPCADAVTSFVFEAGEGSKTLDTVNACYDKLLADDHNRRDLIIGLGGGVTGDVAAFIASTYMRGCRFVNLPTSLLAMADSSVGGKCGVDYDKYKNLVGSIYMPSLVYAATDTLSTLPVREFSSGMGEVLKAGLIRDEDFYDWQITNNAGIMERDASILQEMIIRAVAIKQYYVTVDPFEAGERMILNLGHTIGHALEKYYDFRYLHGECVALGTVAAAYISYKRSMLSSEKFDMIRDSFIPFGLPVSLDSFDTDAVYANIGHDKKNTDSGLKFILLEDIGKAVIVNDVTGDEIKDAIGHLIAGRDSHEQ